MGSIKSTAAVHCPSGDHHRSMSTGTYSARLASAAKGNIRDHRWHHSGAWVLGNIPGYLNEIFPQSSLPLLNMVANFGLVLFLFLIGLELDLRSLARMARSSVFISLAGMAVIRVRCCRFIRIVRLQRDTASNGPEFSSFLLFLGVAMTITAFPGTESNSH